MASLSEDKRLLTYDSFSHTPEVTCFTTTRHGGCSTDNYATFNCGIHTADNPDNVKQNLQTLESLLPHKPKALVIPHQVHGTQHLTIGQDFISASTDERTSMLEGIDVLLTQEKDYCLCISTADCLPIMLYDKAHEAVAAVHAGWRGTRSLITKAALEAMAAEFGTRGEDITAVIGPGISMGAFEVGPEVYQEFKDAGFPMNSISEWKPKSPKYHINLWLANRWLIEEFGVPSGQIEMSGICTYRRYTDFFSARRLGNECGRMLTGIMVNG